MATINYNGMALEEFISDKPVAFPKGTKAVCWDGDGTKCEREILAYIPYVRYRVLTRGIDDCDGPAYMACSLLPDRLEPRMVTNRELARWLAQGNGEVCHGWHNVTSTYFDYQIPEADLPLKDKDDIKISVRKWSDTEWHEPTVDYMGITSDTSFERKYVAD